MTSEYTIHRTLTTRDSGRSPALKASSKGTPNFNLIGDGGDERVDERIDERVDERID